MKNSIRKEKLLCWFGLIVLADKALLPTRIRTSRGDCSVEPIRQIDYRDRDDLIEAIRNAIRIGNPPGEVPEYVLNRTATPIEALIKAKSWADVERKSIYFSTEIFPSFYCIKCWGRACDGKWSDEQDTVLDVRIPAEKGPAEIANVILEHLKTRTDLPGLMLSD